MTMFLVPFNLFVLAMILSLLGYHRCQHMSSYNYRRQMNVIRSLAQKAYEHGIRINEDAQCSKPKPELIYLNDSKKMYLPRATLLHRCSDLHGCCPHATHSCEPIRVEKVTLYFFVIGVQSPNMIRRNQNVEQLTFINHTSCSCKPIHEPVWTTEMINHPDINHDGYENFTQIRLIRDQGSASVKFNELPVPIQGRNSFNEVDKYQHHDRDMYQESEDVLKYWAKLMGYNVEKNFFDIKKRKRNANKNKNKQKSSLMAPNTSRMLFSTPDVTYQYDTLHDPQSTPDYDFRSEQEPGFGSQPSSSSSSSQMDSHDQSNYRSLTSTMDQRQQRPEQQLEINNGHGSMVYTMVPRSKQSFSNSQ